MNQKFSWKKKEQNLLTHSFFYFISLFIISTGSLATQFSSAVEIEFPYTAEVKKIITNAGKLISPISINLPNKVTIFGETFGPGLAKIDFQKWFASDPSINTDPESFTEFRFRHESFLYGGALLVEVMRLAKVLKLPVWTHHIHLIFQPSFSDQRTKITVWDAYRRANVLVELYRLVYNHMESHVGKHVNPLENYHLRRILDELTSGEYSFDEKKNGYVRWRRSEIYNPSTMLGFEVVGLPATHSDIDSKASLLNLIHSHLARGYYVQNYKILKPYADEGDYSLMFSLGIRNNKVYGYDAYVTRKWDREPFPCIRIAEGADLSMIPSSFDLGENNLPIDIIKKFVAVNGLYERFYNTFIPPPEQFDICSYRSVGLTIWDSPKRIKARCCDVRGGVYLEASNGCECIPGRYIWPSVQSCPQQPVFGPPG